MGISQLVVVLSDVSATEMHHHAISLLILRRSDLSHSLTELKSQVAELDVVNCERCRTGDGMRSKKQQAGGKRRARERKREQGGRLKQPFASRTTFSRPGEAEDQTDS